MHHLWQKWGSVLLATMVLVISAACDNDSEQDVRNAGENVQDSASTAGQNLQEAARNAWASLRTDSDRLIDRIQTNGDSEAKQQLLDKCRDTVEQLRKGQSSSADQVNALCNDIRDRNPGDAGWDSIRNRFNDLNNQIQQ